MVNADLVNENSSFDEVYSVLYEIGVEYDDRLENDPDFQLYYYVGEGPLKRFPRSSPQKTRAAPMEYRWA